MTERAGQLLPKSAVCHVTKVVDRSWYTPIH